MTTNELEDLALLRYSAIAPLVNGTYTGTIASFCRATSLNEFLLPNGEKRKFSPDTIERWYYFYKKGGFDMLRKAHRADCGKHRMLDSDITERIKYLKDQYPKLPSSAIYKQLFDQGLIKSGKVSLSTITRFVNEYMDSSRKTNNPDMHRYERPHINEVWCGDSSYGPSKHKIFIIATIDDASRFVTGAGVFLNDNFVNLMSVMKSAVSKYGRPSVWNFDNGKSYKNKQMELLAARIGSSISYCHPYSPQQKAKIERWFLTMKEQWMASLNVKDFDNLEALNESLSAFVQKYNNTVHSSLNGKTPYERFFSESERIHRIPQEDIEKDFLLEIERRVSADCVLTIDQTEYEISNRFAKERVKLRFTPDMEQVYVVESDNSLTPIKLLNKVENANIKREKIRYSGGED